MNEGVGGHKKDSFGGGMVKFVIGYKGEKEDIVILIESPEFGFATPVIWFGSREDFVGFRDMIEEFYLRAGRLPHQERTRVPDIFLDAFDEKDNPQPA